MTMFSSFWMASAGADAFDVDNSAQFNDDDSEYLTRTPTSAGNQKTWTFSFWFKFGSVTGRQMFYAQDEAYIDINENSSTSALINIYLTGVSPVWYWETTAQFRDPHAWYHVVVAFDSPNATADNRLRLYINGEEITTFTKHNTGNQDAAPDIGGTSAMVIGGGTSGTPAGFYDGYFAEYVYVNGRQLGPTSFGEKDDNGVWRPIDVTDSLSSNATQLLVDRTSGTAIGDMTDSTAGNNLAAAFDGTFGGNDGANNATKRGSVANAFVGKNWGSGVSKIITGFSTRDVNNAGYFDNTAEGRFFLYGSNSAPSAYNDGTLLYSGAAFNSTVSAQSKDFLDTGNFDTSTAFQYHWIALVPTSTASDVRMAELIFYEDAGNFGTNGFYLPFTNSAGLGQDYSGSSNTTIVQQNTYNAGSEINNGDTGANPITAAKFVPIASGTISKIELNASSRGFSGVTVRLETDSGSGTAPSGTLVTNGEVTGITSSGAGLKTATFSTPPEVVAGTTYWIGLRGDTGTWGWQHDVAGSGGALGIYQGSTQGYYSGRGLGHYVYMTGSHFTEVNSPTQTTDSPTSNFATLTSIDVSPAVFSNGNLKVTSSTTNSYRGGTSSIGLPPGSGKWYCEALATGSTGSNKEYGFGAVINSTNKGAAFFPGSAGTGNEFGYYSGSGGIIYNDPNSSVGSVGAYGGGDRVALRFDMDASSPTCKFYVNNTLKHTSNLTAGLTYYPHFNVQDSSLSWTVNFGASAFTYTLPTDHLAISAANMFTATSPAIEDGSAHVQATAYSGNASQDHAILQTESLRVPVSTFRPDFCWFGRRDSGDSRNMYDSVRGVTSRLTSNGSAGRDTTAITTHFKTFDDAGFTVGSDGAVNGTSMVCWNWKGAGAAPTQTYTVKVVSDSGNKYRFDDFGTSAVTLDLQEGGTYTFDQSDSSNSGHPLRFSTTSDGSHGGGSEYTTGVTTTGTPGSSGAKTVITVAASAPALYYYCSSHSGMGGAANTNDTFGSSNFSGTIQSKVCANPTAGFSIVTYTGNATSGATVGHGLSVAPSMVHYKRLDQNESWISFVSNIGGGKHVYLNLNFDAQTASNVFNDTAPGASVLTLGDANSTNATGEAFIAYCFSEIPGYCKAGSYTGNNSTDGPLIDLGFSPAIVLVKKTSSSTGGEWYVVDSSRDIENVADNELVWSGANAEDGDQGADHLDFLSNGFKMRCDGAGSANSSDCTTFYMAWAENPFAGTTPATARK